MTTKPIAQAAITMPKKQAKPKKWSPMRRREAIEGILYLSPWILGFIVFVAGP